MDLHKVLLQSFKVVQILLTHLIQRFIWGKLTSHQGHHRLLKLFISLPYSPKQIGATVIVIVW